MRPASFDPSDSHPQQEERSSVIIMQLLRYIWPKDRRGYKVRIVAALSCLVLAKLAGVYLPILYKDIVDHFAGASVAVVIPLALIIAYGAVKLSQSLFAELRDLLFVRVTQSTRRAISLQVFAHLHQLPIQFHLERQTGGLSQVIERGTRAVRFVMSFLVFNIGPTIFELILVVFAMSYLLDIKFALIIVTAVIAYVALTFGVTEWRLKYRRVMNSKDSEASSKAVDSLLNFETVKYFGNESYEYHRYDRSLRGFETAAVQSQGSLMVLNGGQQLIIGLAVVATMILAAQGLLEKRFTVGDFVMVNTFMLQLFIPLNFLGFVYREIKQSLIDMDKMFQILKIPPGITDGPNQLDAHRLRGQIVFDSVAFSYHPQRQILKNISFTIEPGEKVAIVGSSGSGKSTLSKLLMRFYDADAGEIRVDGIPIRTLQLASLRSVLSVVPQDTVLFNDSLRYNIAYGDPEKSEAEIQKVVDQAQLRPLIEKLPEGLQTKVGERGLKLSGGEKQRVAIARALLRDTQLLILDEASSSLDSKTELDITAALRSATSGRSSLVIAHRLSTIVDADRILVMRDGEIIEQGSHAELVAAATSYRRMWQRQQQKPLATKQERKL